MRLVIQRVKNAKVTVVETDQVSGQIEKGLLVLFGAKKGDTKENTDFLVEKLVKMRIMADRNGKMNKTVSNVDGKFLVVSQFTLYANTKDGNRPSFIDAEEPQKAKELYEYFISKLRKLGAIVETGSFGSYMSISAELDGPVTIVLEN